MTSPGRFQPPARPLPSQRPAGRIGFCMGGRYTVLMAVSNDRLNAALEPEA
jgi:dienelactone hydrolase